MHPGRVKRLRQAVERSTAKQALDQAPWDLGHLSLGGRPSLRHTTPLSPAAIRGEGTRASPRPPPKAPGGARRARRRGGVRLGAEAADGQRLHGLDAAGRPPCLRFQNSATSSRECEFLARPFVSHFLAKSEPQSRLSSTSETQRSCDGRAIAPSGGLSICHRLFSTLSFDHSEKDGSHKDKSGVIRGGPIDGRRDRLGT